MNDSTYNEQSQSLTPKGTHCPRVRSSPSDSCSTLKPLASPRTLRSCPRDSRLLALNGGASASQPSRNVDQTTMPPGASSNGNCSISAVSKNRQPCTKRSGLPCCFMYACSPPRRKFAASKCTSVLAAKARSRPRCSAPRWLSMPHTLHRVRSLKCCARKTASRPPPQPRSTARPLPPRNTGPYA
eukprot:6184625-Pleurochrysis_carterae.AAC.3